MENDEDKRAFKIFIQGYLSFLQENEGVIVFEDDDKTKGFVICKIWDHEEQKFIISLVDLKDIEGVDLDKATNGSFIWIHKNKEDYVDALIDEYIDKKDLDNA